MPYGIRHDHFMDFDSRRRRSGHIADRCGHYEGGDYSTNRAGCTARPFVAGFSSTILVNGGNDGFDCGLNVPTATINPGTVTINPGPGVNIKLGEAALNERALISFGTFPVGDGRGLNFLGMTLSFNAGGQPLTFNGTADFFKEELPRQVTPLLLPLVTTLVRPGL